MAAPARRPIAWLPLAGALIAGAAGAGVIGWHLNLQAIDGQITEKQAALKKLTVSGRIPPNQQVMDYLTARQTAVEERYRHWVEAVAAAPVAEASSGDSQLSFQERFHEVQRTLERLAAARSLTVPELLGFPKELPPSETVPRLLTQLVLIEESASLLLEQGVSALSSFKVEDPETVTEVDEETPFLTRLPIRARLTTSLPGLMKVLRALERAKSLIDVRGLRILAAPPGGGAQAGVSGATPESLEVELLLSRYLVVAASTDALPAEERAAPPATRATRTRSD